MKNGPKSFVFDSPLETLCFYIRNALFLYKKRSVSNIETNSSYNRGRFACKNAPLFYMIF